MMRSEWGVGRWGGALALFLLLIAFLGDFIAPFGVDQQVDPVVSSRRPPFTRLWSFESRADGSIQLAEEWHRRGDRIVLERRGASLEVSAADVSGPRRYLYLLGTDRLGRDVFSRVVLGARTSLAVGGLAVALALSLGVLFGGCAALAPPWFDSVIMRFVDGLLAFPQMLLILTLALLFEPSTTLLILIIGGTGWMGLSRLVRAELRRIKSHSFVLASQGLGAGPLRILFRHLLPNAWAPILSAASLMVGDAILIETALSFLGLGVAADLPSWGRMIADGRSNLVGSWWLSAFPGMAVAATVFAFHLISDGLRDALDPRKTTSPDSRGPSIDSRSSPWSAA